MEFYPKNGPHNNIFYPVRGFRSASRSFVETGVGPSKTLDVAKNDTKKGQSILSIFGTDLPSKSISEFSKKEQDRILRQRKMFNKLRNNATTRKRQDK